jgi:hypothetical protein
LHETDAVFLPFRESGERAAPLSALGVIALGFLLLKEFSGEAAIERAQAAAAQACACPQPPTPRARQNVYLTVSNRRFTGIRNCC